jgi:hypothetical protein
MSGLVEHGGNGGYEHCIHCGALAVGPCARCEGPVCGDCCVLTAGGAKTYAICLGCERRAGSSLRRSWLIVISWFVVPILGLALLLFLLGLIAR